MTFKRNGICAARQYATVFQHNVRQIDSFHFYPWHGTFGLQNVFVASQRNTDNRQSKILVLTFTKKQSTVSKDHIIQ
jgi:hypothetical protein